MKKKTLKKISVAVLAAGLAGFLIWDNVYTFKGEGRHFFEGRYYSDFYTFNGKEVIEFQLETGEKLHLDAHIEKGKAKVSFTRKGEKNGEVISNIEDADTYFTADETGRYVVKINFKHAKGTVEIKCDDQVKDKTIYR
ncbi:hypothetical protein [Ruminococcus flavefaciens]|uniref:hypothetical protein n=1 Tax=Ruminococcus flavefaciens TaxID=1265 RepID=UPI0026EC6F8D|nr:hypothetical protein [Ruminococcus flavefaciens]MDD7517718.1 hypothetical protein [Ruminococcus flavefaciens]MDY5690519.1 hypothetical protein [Ruminococcus flavefaciens]